MFHIKICGITNVGDALAVAHSGADALGLNFYPHSSRYISPEIARDIVGAIPAGIVKVGLFVNSPPGDICRLFDDLGLNLVQLHGDEPPELIPQLGRRPVMKAFRVGADKTGAAGLRPIADYLRRCCELDCLPALALLDSAVPGAYGGTGKTGDWSVVQQYTAVPELPSLVLAGGLTPENVAEAIRLVRPAAVDVASGVESSPGRKDAAMIEAFVWAAKAAFNS